ncbi:carboxyltransferase subunit alpha [Lactobacillus sp. ESL0681]|uniref:acetyl-CoA carboxylase carboxyltransferase subunit alpha n=1 Tax=Lactobacillus sp. ESL0681 TaxID=2983211 RepID=UPI0023F9B376|nr:carboxyltransferase subunit alpha [Lactobacillus sp. ESL0681]WEV40503.1 acetyl-CoA carboxylase carboxyl transferase subunit alpha [Lactobacillus sp. ESL0681]
MSKNKKIAEIMAGARSTDKTDMMALVKQLCPDFFEMHGDRVAADDPAIIAGLATINGRAVAVIATNKGQDLDTRMATNFGSPTPQGYRKALRVMKTAQALNLPIITLINTPGAYPGATAEASGQGQILAKNISEMLQLTVPLLTIIIGEAGSGGALALACSDRVWMLEHSMYTAVSPEGFASIMYKDGQQAQKAADVMHIEPAWLKEHEIVEQVLPERVLANDAAELKQLIAKQLEDFDQLSLVELLEQRQVRYRKF